MTGSELNFLPIGRPTRAPRAAYRSSNPIPPGLANLRVPTYKLSKKGSGSPLMLAFPFMLDRKLLNHLSGRRTRRADDPSAPSWRSSRPGGYTGLMDGEPERERDGAGVPAAWPSPGGRGAANPFLPEDAAAARRRQGLALAAVLILLLGIAIGAVLFRRPDGSLPLVQSASEGSPAAGSWGRAFAPRGEAPAGPAGAARFDGRWEPSAPGGADVPRDRLLVAPQGERDGQPMRLPTIDGYAGTGGGGGSRAPALREARPSAESSATAASAGSRDPVTLVGERISRREESRKALFIKTGDGNTIELRRKANAREAAGAKTTETGVNAIQGGDGFKIMDGVPKSLRE